MAKVRAGDRAKTKKRTGSKKYVMETAAQIRSAIRLRHHSKKTARGGKVSSGAVLSRASRAVSRLRSAGKISAATATSLRRLIAAARLKDRKR